MQLFHNVRTFNNNVWRLPSTLARTHVADNVFRIAWSWSPTNQRVILKWTYHPFTVLMVNDRKSQRQLCSPIFDPSVPVVLRHSFHLGPGILFFRWLLQSVLKTTITSELCGKFPLQRLDRRLIEKHLESMLHVTSRNPLTPENGHGQSLTSSSNCLVREAQSQFGAIEVWPMEFSMNPLEPWSWFVAANRENMPGWFRSVLRGNIELVSLISEANRKSDYRRPGVSPITNSYLRIKTADWWGSTQPVQRIHVEKTLRREDKKRKSLAIVQLHLSFEDRQIFTDYKVGSDDYWIRKRLLLLYWSRAICPQSQWGYLFIVKRQQQEISGKHETCVKPLRIQCDTV